MSRLLLIAVLAGCEPVAPGADTDDTDGGSPTADMLSSETWEDSTNADGLIKVKVDVDDDVTSFMVTGESNQWVSLEQLKDPDGNVVLHWQDWWTSTQSLTNAFFGFDKATGFNWPIREVDGPLAKGTWTVELATVDMMGYYASNANITLTVHKKDDDDLAAGVTKVAILWADGVDDDPDVVAAVEDAVERWHEVWGEYGLEFEETYLSTDLDPMLGFTYTGANKVENAAEDLEEGTLVVVVGEQVQNEQGTYGVSGGIPGSLAPTDMTFVVVAWLPHAGTDGTFEKADTRLMGETMAHEVGHYVGLFHPVEWDYNFWDALEDTPECTGWQSCESEMGDNLMFPYPICGFDSCNPQDKLTKDQRAVAHRYTGML